MPAWITARAHWIEATAEAPPIGVVAENRRSLMPKLVMKSSATAPWPYGISPSISDGFSPASRMAANEASSWNDSAVRSVPRRYFVSPTPVMAPASRSDIRRLLFPGPPQVRSAEVARQFRPHRFAENRHVAVVLVGKAPHHRSVRRGKCGDLRHRE